jgi:mannose-6-phosphate isomerase-like protein (cupin superfamily)
MLYQAINFQQKLSLFTERWSPKIIAQLNEYQFKLAHVEGEFDWHGHKETDEPFIVIEGEMRIDFRDGHVLIGEGEMYVVPKGVEHRPVAEKPCKIMLIEPAGTVNTGEAGGALTAPNDVWV